MAFAKDLTGKKFGRYTVLGSKGKDKNRNFLWLCKCECENERIVKASTLLTGRTQSCGCKNADETKIRNSISKWKGHGEISGSYWAKLKKEAKHRNINFDITIEDAWKIFIAQNKKCALTDIDLNFARLYSSKNNQTASLDRINSNLGYTVNNVQWVHKDINIIKNNLPQEEFVDLCDRITYFQENKHAKYDHIQEEAKPIKLKAGYYLANLPKIETPVKGVAYDIIGKRFGRYIVLERVKTHERISNWLCLCDCGTKKIVRGRALIKGKISSCGCYRKQLDKTCITGWKGYEEISGSYLQKLKKAASRRDLNFNLSIKEMWDQFIRQNKYCAYTGEKLNFVRDYNRSSNQTASLDRINSDLDYSIDNVQWIHKKINTIKWDYEEKYFLKMCKMVAGHKKQTTKKSVVC